MDKGHVKWIGNSNDLPQSLYLAFSPLNELDTNMHVQGQERSIGTCSEDRLEVVPDKNSVCPTERAKNITEDEVRKDGRVEVTVYK